MFLTAVRYAAAIVLISFALEVSAQTEPPTAVPEPVIEAKQNHPLDGRIQTRLKGIYNEIEALDSLVVEVSEGVVTVNGSVSSEAQAQTALLLAKRIEGVVTVEDNIERTLDIEGNLTPKIEEYMGQLAKWFRATPLLLFSVVVAVVISLAGHILAKWSGLWRRIAPNPFLGELLAHAVRVVFIVFGVVTALNLIGANAMIGTVLGGAGVLGLAIGFAIRDTMEITFHRSC